MSESNELIQNKMASSPEPQVTQLVSNNTLLEQLNDLLSAGGPVVIILIIMSIIALAIIMYKAWQFHILKLSNRKLLSHVLDLYKRGENEKALQLSGESINPVMQAMHKAMQGRQGKLPEELIREEVQRYGSDALFELRLGFRPLEVIASLAPLLGLLGTVLGMIEAFKQLSAAGSKVNPAILSGGIWEALLTTAVGLIVAIPVVALLNWLERRVDQVAHDLENYVTQIFTQDMSNLLHKQSKSKVSSAKISSISNESTAIG